MNASPLEHRGVVLVDPSLLPALVPAEAEQEAVPLGNLRLVRAGGQAEGTRPIFLAPASDVATAVRDFAAAGATALIFVGTCVSPTRGLEPGDVLVVEAWRGTEGLEEAHAAMANKLVNRCGRRGVKAKRGIVASGGLDAQTGDLGEDRASASVLRAAREAGVPAGALLVCLGTERGGTEAPAAVLATFDHLFGVLQEILGSVRTPGAQSPHGA